MRQGTTDDAERGDAGEVRHLVSRLCGICLRSLLVGDVHARADVASKVVLRYITRHTVVRNPAVFSVMPAQTVLHGKGTPRVEGLDINLHTARQVLRMHSFRPPSAE